MESSARLNLQLLRSPRDVPANLAKSEPTRATVKVPKAVKQNYTDADKTRTVDRDGTTHWRTPNGLFCKAPQSAVAAESAGMSPPTSSTTPKPEPTRARATVRVPEAVKQNYTDADKTRSVDRDGTTHWRTPNGKFCKAESAVAAEPPAKPQPTTTTSRPEPARATVNVAERVQVNYTDADKTRSVDRNGITRWRTPNGRFCSAPEYFSSSSSGYSSFGSNYGFGSFGGAGGGYRQDANGRWHGANGRFCKAPW